MSVNFGGLVAWGNQAAQLFRTQRAGALVGISSIYGNRGRKGNPAYGASKAAMDNWLEALRNRLAGEGVHVCTVKPGYIATRMTAGRRMFWVAGAEQAAAAVLQAARSGTNVRYVLRRWRVVGTLLPSFPPSCSADWTSDAAGIVRPGPRRSYELVEGGAWRWRRRACCARATWEIRACFELARRDGAAGLRAPQQLRRRSVNATGHVLDISHGSHPALGPGQALPSWSRASPCASSGSASCPTAGGRASCRGRCSPPWPAPWP
jgi:hypothetical protein